MDINKKQEKNKESGVLQKNDMEKYGDVLSELLNERREEVPEKETVKTVTSNKEKFLTVSKVSGYIKDVLANDPNLNQIYVRGEIKNLSKSPSKYIYFDIQEENALLNCVLPEDKNKETDFKLEKGADVFVFGSIQTSREKSIYQLDTDLILPAWKGEIILKFEQLKDKLSEEGLFDEKHKKEIPYLYKTLGLIISKDSETNKEVIGVLKRRFPVNIKRIVVDTRRENASGDIINAINALNKIKELGIILIVSGSKAMEDLKCFNDEPLARAIYNSKTPVITGIGSETDYTIADFVADKRAPAPEIAVKTAVPDREEVIDRIELKKESPKTGYENLTVPVEKDIVLKKKYNEVPGKKDRTKIYKLILLVILLIIFIIVLIFLVGVLL